MHIHAQILAGLACGYSVVALSARSTGKDKSGNPSKSMNSLFYWLTDNSFEEWLDVPVFSKNISLFITKNGDTVEMAYQVDGTYTKATWSYDLYKCYVQVLGYGDLAQWQSGSVKKNTYTQSKGLLSFPGSQQIYAGTNVVFSTSTTAVPNINNWIGKKGTNGLFATFKTDKLKMYAPNGQAANPRARAKDLSNKSLALARGLAAWPAVVSYESTQR